MKKTVIIFMLVIISAASLLLLMMKEKKSYCFFAGLSPEVQNFPSEIEKITGEVKGYKTIDDTEYPEMELKILNYYNLVDSILDKYSRVIGKGMPVAFSQNSSKENYEIQEVMFIGCNLNRTGADIHSDFMVKLKMRTGREPGLIKAEFIDDNGMKIQSEFFYQSFEDSVINNVRIYKCNVGDFEKLKKLKKIILQL